MKQKIHHLTFLFLVLLPFAAVAQTSPTTETTPAPGKDETVTTTINSDTLQLDLAKGEGFFSGKVHVTSPKFDMTSDEMTVIFGKDGKPQKFIAKGNINMTNGDRTGTSHMAEYDVAEKKITMTGDPVVTQQQNRVTGTTIVIYPETDRMDVTGRTTVHIQQ